MACWGQQLKAPSRGDNHLPSLRGMEAWLTGWRGLVPWPRLPHLHLHPGDHRWKGVVTEIWPEGPQCSTDHVSCSGSGQDAGNRSPPVLRNLRNLPRGPRPQASLRVIHSANVRALLSQPRKLTASSPCAALVSRGDHSLHQYPAGAQSGEDSKVGEGSPKKLGFSGPGGSPLGIREPPLPRPHPRGDHGPPFLDRTAGWGRDSRGPRPPSPLHAGS